MSDQLEMQKMMKELAVYLKEKRNAPGPLEILQKWEETKRSRMSFSHNHT